MIVVLKSNTNGRVMPCVINIEMSGNNNAHMSVSCRFYNSYEDVIKSMNGLAMLRSVKLGYSLAACVMPGTEDSVMLSLGVIDHLTIMELTTLILAERYICEMVRNAYLFNSKVASN